jgi:WD40 repeat protein
MIDLKTGQIQEIPTKEKEVDPLEQALYHLGYSKWSFNLPRTAISPDQKILAVASESILLWGVESRELISVLENKTGYPLGEIHFDPTGQFLAGAISDHEILLWDITENIEHNTPKILSDQVTECTMRDCGDTLHREDGCYFNCPQTTFSPDGKLLAFTNERTTVELWNTQTATKFATFPILQDKESWITAIQFSKDGQFIYISSIKQAPLREIQVWSVSTKQKIRQIEVSITGAYQNIDTISWPWLAFSRGEGGTNNGIGIWNVETQTVRKFNIGNNTYIKGFDQSGELLVVDSLCSAPYILRVATGEFIYQFAETPFQNFSTLANSNFVMSVGMGAVDLWNIEDLLGTLQKPNLTPFPSPTYLPCFPG